jgi:hypothetical protein
VIRRTAPFNRFLRHTRGYGGSSILNRILTESHSVDVGLLILTVDCTVYLIWTHWFWLLILALEMERTVGATGRQGVLTPPMHLMPPLIYPDVYGGPILKFVFPTGPMRLVNVRYLCYFFRIRSVFNLRQSTEKRWYHREFHYLVYRQLTVNFTVITTILE